jgi:hypothetical protein
MTTQPDRITAQEIRDLFADLRAEIEDLRTDIAQIREGLQQAASQPAAPNGTFGQMMIDTIIMTYDDSGKPAYKATGAPYNKFGVRVWDEILPALGIDPESLKPGKNPQQPEIPARVLMNAPKDGKSAQPRKVTGKI